MSLVLALYRFLLRLYPERFREAYGDEMTALVQARLERTRRERPWAIAPATVLALLDLVWSAILARFFPSKGPSRETRRARPRPRRGDALVDTALRSLRLGSRSLGREPSLVVAVVLTMTLGTGATIALFTIADGAVLRPLRYPDADELVSIVQSDPKFGLVPFAPPYLEDLRERTTSFDLVAGFSPSWSLKLTGIGEPRIVQGAFVSDGVLDLIGARPSSGRAFSESEHRPGGARVALVTRAFWNRTFGLEASFAPRGIRLDGELYTIVGVMPDDVRLPLTTSIVNQRQVAPAEVFLPFSSNPYSDLRMVPVMNLVGRLREDVSFDRAREELEAVGESLSRDFPETSRSEVTGVFLDDLVTRDSRRTVWVLFGAAAFLLLIACANVANLLLARAAGRETEVAIRASLGARRRQVVGQLLVESLWLALLGSAGGLLLAWWLLETIPSLGLEGLPPSAVIRIDLRVVLFALVLAAGTSLLFGLAPALHASRNAEAGVLRGARFSRSAGRARNVLVSLEIALALTLLVGAGLLARSYWNLLHTDPGFRADGLLGVPVDLTSDTYDPDSRRAFVSELLRRLETLPGVRSAAAVNRLPLSGSNVLVGVEVEGLTDSFESEPVVDRRVATPAYFDTMGIPILEGRSVEPTDGPESMPVAVVNETLARRFWPRGAIGRRVRLKLRSGPGPWLTVVGVSGDVRHHGLGASAEPELYVAYEQSPVESVVAVLRSSSDPLAIAARAREEVWALDETIPLDRLGPVSASIHESVAEPRFRMLVLNGFGGLALLLAAIGVYGVTAYTVSRQTREIGLRMALGAEGRRVVSLVVGRGMVLACWGVGLGLTGAFFLSRLLESYLFGVTPTDLPTFALVSSILLVVAAAASAAPALRATRVDPMEALRIE